MTTKNIDLVAKVNGYIRELEELRTLIHEFVTAKSLENEFYKFLDDVKESDYYTTADIEHMMLDYTGYDK